MTIKRRVNTKLSWEQLIVHGNKLAKLPCMMWIAPSLLASLGARQHALQSASTPREVRYLVHTGGTADHTSSVACRERQQPHSTTVFNAHL